MAGSEPCLGTRCKAPGGPDAPTRGPAWPRAGYPNGVDTTQDRSNDPKRPRKGKSAERAHMCS
eukprot:15471265-Alexandrium_andersonii.AAC.3